MARLELFTPPVFFAQDATPGGTNEPEQQPEPTSNPDDAARELMRQLEEAFREAIKQPPSPKEPPANP